MFFVELNNKFTSKGLVLYGYVRKFYKSVFSTKDFKI